MIISDNELDLIENNIDLAIDCFVERSSDS